MTAHDKKVGKTSAWKRDITITIVIPAYNEEQAIGATLERLIERFPDFEIIVVNDGSQDRTGEIVRKFPSVRIIEHEVNKGYGSAIKSGARAANGAAIAWLDADGQHTAENLESLIEKYRAGGYDAVIGARDNASHVQLQRLPGKIILSLIVQFVAGQRIPDINCGLRIFKRHVLLRYLDLLPHGFSASLTTTLLLIKRGYNISYAKITTRERIGKSTVNQIRDGFNSIQTILRILILFQAFSTFTFISGWLVGGGILYGLYIFRVQYGLAVGAAVMILSGITVFCMGLLTDQVVALRLELLERGWREQDIEK